MRNDSAAQERSNSRRGNYKTRCAIRDLLKRVGPQSANALAARLDLTAMAVRQQLYELAAKKLVDNEARGGGVGRPAKLWRLTADADRFFPDGHAELTADLLSAMGEAFGARGLEKLLKARERRQVASYRARLGKGALKRRLEALAALRSAEGYMAAVEKGADGSWLLVENHCPICAAARLCSGLCSGELAVFRAALGPGVAVERIDHILAGARRCAYRVSPKRS
ncbi:MAG: helix-turn-helix transcriptional regulator [Kiloniellales bacterium]